MRGACSAYRCALAGFICGRHAISPLLFAARGRRRSLHSLPSCERARGTPGARCTHGPGADAVFGKGKCARQLPDSPVSPGVPHAMRLRLASCSFRRNGRRPELRMRLAGRLACELSDPRCPVRHRETTRLGPARQRRRQRLRRWFTALVGAAQPPASAPDAAASPHPAPRIVTIASRPSQWSGTRWIIILIGILSRDLRRCR